MLISSSKNMNMRKACKCKVLLLGSLSEIMKDQKLLILIGNSSSNWTLMTKITIKAKRKMYPKLKELEGPVKVLRWLKLRLKMKIRMRMRRIKKLSKKPIKKNGTRKGLKWRKKLKTLKNRKTSISSSKKRLEFPN